MVKKDVILDVYKKSAFVIKVLNAIQESSEGLESVMETSKACHTAYERALCYNVHDKRLYIQGVNNYLMLNYDISSAMHLAREDGKDRNKNRFFNELKTIFCCSERVGIEWIRDDELLIKNEDNDSVLFKIKP